MSHRKSSKDDSDKKIIHAYRKYNLLWDTSHADFNNNSKRGEALDQVADLAGVTSKFIITVSLTAI